MENEKVELTPDVIKYILSVITSRADEAVREMKENKNDEFKAGRGQAYYEVLDIIKSRLIVYDQDLKEFGLDVDLDKKYT